MWNLDASRTVDLHMKPCKSEIVVSNQHTCKRIALFLLGRHVFSLGPVNTFALSAQVDTDHSKRDWSIEKEHLPKQAKAHVCRFDVFCESSEASLCTKTVSRCAKTASDEVRAVQVKDGLGTCHKAQTVLRQRRGTTFCNSLTSFQLLKKGVQQH